MGLSLMVEGRKTASTVASVPMPNGMDFLLEVLAAVAAGLAVGS